jgi:putative oxidoreductase
MFHGLQKVLGLFTEKGAQPFLGGTMQAAGINLMWIAGVIELVGGILIVIGLFTSLAAALSAIVMLVAYFVSHMPRGALPIMNGGELALVYFAAFLYVVFEGGGKCSVDALLAKR